MKKLFLAMVMLMLITGCKSKVLIKIDGTSIEENLYYLKEKSELINNDISATFDNDVKPYLGMKGTVEGFRIEPIENYTERESAMRLYNTYKSFEQLSNSLLLQNCYDLYKISKENEDYYNITTSDRFTCFDRYKELDNVELIIETNNDVSYSNADKIEENKYIWNITRTNSDSKKISITISKNKNEEKAKKEKDKIKYREILIGLGLVTGIIILITLGIAIKHKRVNKI